MGKTMENWESDLLKACLSIPLSITATKVYEKTREYLKLRKVEIICHLCNKSFIANSYLEQKNKRCPECMGNRKEEREQFESKRKEQKQTYENQKQTKKMENYLNGFGNTAAGDFWILMEHTTKEDTQSLKNMAYDQFLQTRHWKVISKYVKWQNGYCALCKSQINLNVHHKTYEHKGEEHLYYKNDLICLCKICHRKHHNIGDLNNE